MKQREIHLVQLGPVIANEQDGVRPVVVISGDTMNNCFKMSIVCPLSTSIKNYTSAVLIKKSDLNGLKFDSEALTFQMRTISQKRSLGKLGEISEVELSKIIFALNEVLFY